jgi:hypothetical protein
MASRTKRPKQFYPASAYVRYRDGLWIQSRKRVYLYWFKFLQEAERSTTHTVDWSKYEAWGGRDAVMNSRFDDWWEAHWKVCFGMTERLGTPLHPLSTAQPKANAYRIALLVYQQRKNVKLKYREIAARILEIEKGKGTASASLSSADSQTMIRVVNRYISAASNHLQSVRTGHFP